MKAIAGFAATLLSACAVISVASAAPPATPQPHARQQLATCFWEGPISTRRPTTRGFDGRNFNFPEESATYWMARFHLDGGAHIELRGRFPHGRYMSLNAYSDGAPTDTLSDVAIKARPGHTNPFVAGNRRGAKKRGWRVEVVNESPPGDASRRAPNTLYAEPAAGSPIELFLRVYEPDPGYGLTGGTPLPRPLVIRADGTVLRGDPACESVNDADRTIPTQTIPAPVWTGARNSPGCDGDTNPAYDPIRWERFFNLNYASLAVITDCTEEGRQQRLAMGGDLQGGLYSNRDSAYVYAHLAREFGPVVVVQGKLPRFPRTFSEPKRMPPAQLRFWSLCTGESRVTVRTPDCLADRQVLHRSGRNYTIAVSKAADRPANARKKCGIAWLDWGDRGDGAGDPDYGLLIMRNMLVSPGFENAIQRVEQPGTEAEVMGPYFPRAQYSSVEDFEARGC
jgi:hypothetical protein